MDLATISEKEILLMKKTYRIFSLLSLVLLASCLPFNAPVTQPDAPNVETIVAATYAASVAQTEAVLPFATETALNTATPTRTPVPATITPTFTPTFVLVLPSLTPLPTNTPEATSTPGRFDCEFISQTPQNGVILKPRENFKWAWTVKNTGIKEWIATDVKYFYVSGDKLHEKDIQGIPNNVALGKEVTLKVAMTAPANAGSYSTTWALKRGAQVFCYVQLNITVE